MLNFRLKNMAFLQVVFSLNYAIIMTMDLRQNVELRHLLVPELRQSLEILALPLPELKSLVEQELQSNPFLEEARKEPGHSLPARSAVLGPENDFSQSLITKKLTLQDILIRQLGMFTSSEKDFQIGMEIIGNLDENGYLKVCVDEICQVVKAPAEKVEQVLKMVQKFEPAGVAARDIRECLKIQLEFLNEADPLVLAIVEGHLEDLAKKRYSRIAKTLKEPLEKVENAVKKILRLNPKPGRDYSAEAVQNIIPDIIIDEKGDGLEVTVNDEDIPALNINKAYKEMLKTMADPSDKEFLAEKLRNALELLRSINKRRRTLKSVIEVIVEIQGEAVQDDFSKLKPLTFKQVAERLGLHETTICRVVMNKYAQTPHGVVALKDFFPRRLQDQSGQEVSSHNIKCLIKELIDGEDKKHPLSDQEIVRIIAKERNLEVARRTVAKYREELKILSTSFRRER